MPVHYFFFLFAFFPSCANEPRYNLLAKIKKQTAFFLKRILDPALWIIKKLNYIYVILLHENPAVPSPEIVRNK